jgi:hypothetical protein
MGEEYHYDKLAFLNRAYHHTIPAASVPPAPLEGITTPLYPHQTSLVAAMHQHRQRMTMGYLVGDQAINGNMGILADRAGTGKTLSILAYLASASAPLGITHRATLTRHSLPHFYSHTLAAIPQPTPRTHLVIVPHALFASWRAQIAQHTTLPVVAVETRRHLRDPVALRAARVVLTTSKCYKAVQQAATDIGLQWDCIVIDEASSIHFHPSDPPLAFQFLWLVSSNWIPLMMQTPIITKSTLYHLRNRLTDLHPDLERWLIDSVTSRYEGQLVAANFFQALLPFHHPQRTELLLHHSSAAFTDLLPRPRVEHQQCRPNITLHSLMSFYLSRNMEPQIRTSQIPHLFQALHVEWKAAEAYAVGLPVAKQARVSRTIEESECVICFEPCRYPTILACCHHVYCGKCVLQQMMLNPRCPMCRETIAPRHLTCLESPAPPQTAEQPSKVEACMRLFRDNPAGCFMVYSSFDNIFFQMAEEMDKVGLRAERLEPRLFALQKTVRNVQQGRTKILFISNAEWIRGMSFPAITHLIFYHEPSVHEWKDVLLHSTQRLGRTSPLTVVHLHSEIQV